MATHTISKRAAHTKFAYLKEVVEPLVRKGIDGLPYTSEGYERAKNILQTIYSHTSEIICVCGKQPRTLCHFPNTSREDSRFLRHTRHVQSLENLGKALNCKALARRVLNKLSGIKAELVQGKPDWKTWDFTQFINALRE